MKSGAGDFSTNAHSIIQILSGKFCMEYMRFATPLGDMVLMANDVALQHAFFVDRPGVPLLGASLASAENTLLNRARVVLKDYFDGHTCAWDIPIMPNGTDFQQAVWRAVCDIESGQTISYSELARSMGRADAVRAVAQAAARNPIVIFVPCHRVIGANGSLVGYSAGMLRKQHLLTLEGSVFNSLG